MIGQRVLAEGMHTMDIAKTVSWGDPFYKAPVPAESGRAYSFNQLGLVVLDVTLPAG
jgi:hypothetical protein